MTDCETTQRTFTLRGGPADGARFRLQTCEHDGWADLGLYPNPAKDWGTLPAGFEGSLLYRYDEAADAYVYIGQSAGRIVVDGAGSDG